MNLIGFRFVYALYLAFIAMGAYCLGVCIWKLGWIRCKRKRHLWVYWDVPSFRTSSGLRYNGTYRVCSRCKTEEFKEHRTSWEKVTPRMYYYFNPDYILDKPDTYQVEV